jgi:hypothetical protein
MDIQSIRLIRIPAALLGHVSVTITEINAKKDTERKRVCH